MRRGIPVADGERLLISHFLAAGTVSAYAEAPDSFDGSLQIENEFRRFIFVFPPRSRTTKG